MLSLFDNKKIVCGVDEAGRGSLAGPVTAAAVILPKNYKNSFIKDSKKINHKERNRFYKWTLIGTTILLKKEWISLFKKINFNGDYYFSSSKSLGV